MQIILLLRKRDASPVISVSSVPLDDKDLDYVGRSKDFASIEDLEQALRRAGALSPEHHDVLSALTPDHRAKLHVSEEQARLLDLLDDGLGLTAW